MASSLANNVCLCCRKRKKKCDKTLPSCLQCKSLNITCVYGNIRSVSMIEEFRDLRKKLRAFEALLVSGTTNTNDAILMQPRLSPSELSSDANEASVQSSLVERLESLKHEPGAIDKEIRKLFQSNPGELYSACQLYFHNIHNWIPILSQKLFHQKMTRFSNEEYPEFALLLLSMLLLIHYPRSGTAIEPLDEVIRSMYWQLVASVDTPVELVQAGILIASYEYGNYMIGQCYKTIGSCARIALWINLHRSEIPTSVARGSNEWFERAEERNVWWALVILDRYTHVPGAVFDKPFAISEDLVPTHFPLEASELDPYAIPCAAPIFRRQAEACIIFGKVTSFRTRQSTVQSALLENERTDLDRYIRDFMGLLIDHNSDSAYALCAALAMVFASLLLLHVRNDAQSPADTEEGLQELPSVATSLALTSTVRMVVDVARSFNHCLRDINLMAIPPVYCYVFNQAILELLASRDAMEDIDWLDNLETLLRATWGYSRRWQTSAHHLQAMDRVVSDLSLGSAPSYDTFRPLPNEPSLTTLLY
ncbi:hypothetical protein GGI35DRAFT_204202 [Trichoderma velutinum]